MKQRAHLRFGAMSLANWPVVRILSLVSTKLVKRRSNSVAFIGMGGDFRDNSAYAYLDGVEQLGDCVWLANSDEECVRLESIGVRAVTRKSLAGIRVLMRSGTVIACDNSYWLAWFGRGARIVNLWHGIPTKRIGYDVHGELGYRFPSPSRRDPLARAIRSGRVKPDLLVSISETITPHFMSAFDVDRSRCLEIGYPRCDHLVAPSADSPAAAALREFHQIDMESDQVFRIGYFPTWRDSGSTSRVAETLRQLIEADLGFDFEIIFKPHHLMADLDVPTSTTSAATVRTLPSGCDLNSTLGFIDVLVSDYSSVCWDFLLLDRPTVFVETDRAQYSDERGFYTDVAAQVYGDVVEDLAELNVAVASAAANPQRHADRRAASLALLWGDRLGQSTNELVARLAEPSS